jgi:hypothetical protein
MTESANSGVAPREDKDLQSDILSQAAFLRVDK